MMRYSHKPSLARLFGHNRPRLGPLFIPGAAPFLLAGIACTAFGQTADRPKFEVASVKETPANARNSAGMTPQAGGRLRVVNFPVRMLIMRAYQLQESEIVGGAEWLRSEGFDIEAKGGDPEATNAQLMLMLQSLLEERFRLKYHRETRELPVFGLTLGKDGSKLAAPQEGGCVKVNQTARAPSPGVPCGRISTVMTPSGMAARGGDLPMPEFIRALAGILGQPVLDRTGITTRFDLRLEFAVDDTLAGLMSSWGWVQGHLEAMAASSANNPGAAPNILTAVQEQLGLKLERSKGPAEVMVIEHVQKPGPN